MTFLRAKKRTIESVAGQSCQVRHSTGLLKAHVNHWIALCLVSVRVALIALCVRCVTYALSALFPFAAVEKVRGRGCVSVYTTHMCDQRDPRDRALAIRVVSTRDWKIALSGKAEIDSERPCWDWITCVAGVNISKEYPIPIAFFSRRFLFTFDWQPLIVPSDFQVGGDNGR